MRNCLVLLLLLPALAVAQTIYKHVDEEGNVTYSDEPMTDDAQTVDLPPLSVVESNRRVPPASRDGTVEDVEGEGEESEEPVIDYQLFRFAAPEDDEALWGTSNSVLAVVRVVPVLAPGHQIRYSLDGQQIAETASTRIQLTDVFRGTHNLTAEIVDRRGTVHSSTGVTFHLKQPSVINPANPAVQAPRANQVQPANRRNGGG